MLAKTRRRSKIRTQGAFRKAGASRPWFKICLVSPESKEHEPNRIDGFARRCEGYEIDVVCAKRADLRKKGLRLGVPA